MANLLVRNIDDAVVDYHRKILEQALLHPQKKSFISALKQIPCVGDDQDFERQKDTQQHDVFT